MVLTEFADRVVMFEREPALLADAAPVLEPFGVEIQPIIRISDLPAPSRTFQFAMTFTVLQHLTEDELKPAIDEIKRIVARPGYVLLCEDTDAAFHMGNTIDGGGVTIGRSVEHYACLMEPFTLVSTSPRRVEPVYYRPNCGTYMLFYAE
jgi:SAM-dependent methyltransferase